MKKISMEECYQTALVNLWNHIDALQKELDRLERVGGERRVMTVDALARDIRIFWEETFQERDPLDTDESIVIAKFIQPLTVQQGFMVERIIRVEGRGGNSLEAYYQDGHSQVFDFVDGEWAPRPAPKTRTVGDMVRGLANAKLTPDQIDQLLDLCRAAGIDLTVTEE